MLKVSATLVLSSPLKATRKFRGLGPPFWHHHNDERAHLITDEKLQKAKQYLEDQQVRGGVMK